MRRWTVRCTYEETQFIIERIEEAREPLTAIRQALIKFSEYGEAVGVPQIECKEVE